LDSRAYQAVFETGGTPILGSYAILPMIGRREVAARPADHRRIETANRSQDVLAESGLVGERRAFVVYAPIDAAAKMLRELAEDHWIDAGDDLIAIDRNPGGFG
jgi:hypothetical protein